MDRVKGDVHVELADFSIFLPHFLVQAFNRPTKVSIFLEQVTVVSGRLDTTSHHGYPSDPRPK